MLCIVNRFRKSRVYKVDYKYMTKEKIPSYLATRYNDNPIKRGDMIMHRGDFYNTMVFLWDGNAVADEDWRTEISLHSYIPMEFNWPEFPVDYFIRCPRSIRMYIHPNFEEQLFSNISMVCPVENKKTEFLHSWVSAPMDLQKICNPLTLSELPLELIDLIGQMAGEVVNIVECSQKMVDTGKHLSEWTINIFTLSPFASAPCELDVTCSCGPPAGEYQLYSCI